MFSTEIHGRKYEVNYSYSPGMPGVHTLRNGDPGYPDEPATVEDIELTYSPKTGPWAGRKFVLKNIPDKVIEELTEEIIKHEDDSKLDYEAEIAEMEHDEMVMTRHSYHEI